MAPRDRTRRLLLAAAWLVVSSSMTHASGPAGSLAPRAAQSSKPSGVAQVQESLLNLRRELAQAYSDLAAACQDVKLYAQRDLMFAGLIGVDPENADARKRLGYRWNRKTKEWERGRYREPKDHATDEAQEAFQLRRASVAQGLRERLLALTSKPGITREMRESEVRLYLPLAPDDAYLRRAVGQVAGGEEGVWLSADAVLTTKRRLEMDKMFADAQSRVPELEVWEVGPPTHDLALRWVGAWKTPRVKLTGTVEAEELRVSAMTVHAISEFLPELLPSARYSHTLGTDDDLSGAPITLGRYTVYLLQGPSEARVLVEAWPHLTPEQRELYPRVAAGWLDGFHSLGVWDTARAKRLDALARQVVGMYLGDNFGVSTRQGWVWEGLGLYLTHLTVGTRMMYFIRTDSYVDNKEGPRLGARLMTPQADWLGILVEEMQKERPPRLVFLLGKDVNSMTIRELLLAYGLAAYLVEMHPSLLPNILKHLGGGAKPVDVLEGEFGRSLPDIEKDLLEWAHMAIRL